MEPVGVHNERKHYGRMKLSDPYEEVDEEVIIYGLGPLWFWDCKNVSRPSVEDMIKVAGYTVEYNDVQRNIAVSYYH